MASLPDRDEWQGVYVLDDARAQGENMLRQVREMNRDAGMPKGTEVGAVLPGTGESD